MNYKQKIEDALLGTKREGMGNLITWMNKNGFYTAPCSGKYHLSVEGGLAIHTCNVLDNARLLNECLNDNQIPDENIVIAAVLHDLGKCGEYGKPNYIENILKSGKQSEAEPYKTNPELQYIEHEIRSIKIASNFIDLTEDESMAILYHNGLYGKLMSSFSHPAETPLMLIIHWADMWACRVDEEEE